MSVHGKAKKVTTHTLQEMKRAGEKTKLQHMITHWQNWLTMQVLMSY